MSQVPHVPTVGVVYKFEFDPGYNAFDGVYQLTKLTTYDQYLQDGGNLLNDFYTPNDKTETDLNNDLAMIRESRIMQLLPPDASITETDKIKYAPLCFLAVTPDHNVSKYQDFGIICKVGTTKQASDLDYIRNALVEHIEAALGITPDPRYVILQERWLTTSEYNDIVSERDESKQKILNYYSENQRLEAKLRDLQTLLNEYERTIIILNQQQSDAVEIIQDVPLTTIQFDANGGTGEMSNVRRYSQAQYKLPECTFTPPEGMVFNQWSDTQLGDGDILADPGSTIDLSTLDATVTLYATWKADIGNDAGSTV